MGGGGSTEIFEVSNRGNVLSILDVYAGRAVEKSCIHKLTIELYWMRERWEYQEGIPEFMEDYLKKERLLASLTGQETFNWTKEGF